MYIMYGLVALIIVAFVIWWCNKAKSVVFKKTGGGSIKVGLLGFTNVKPNELASHAAFTCYQDKLPELGKLIDVEKRLFNVGHHTTLQHWHATFAIEGIAVSDVTFGLHLASPFYNSDQRSGRFCSAMFANPDYFVFGRYIREFWPEVDDDKLDEIRKYLEFAIDCYKDNLYVATVFSKKHLAIERPKLSEKSLDASCEKIAQEQMRMFIPIIFPTALDYTINLSSLVTLWTCAWSPQMRAVTDIMRNLVLERNPEIAFMFNPEWRRKDDWYPKKAKTGQGQYAEKPKYVLENLVMGKGFRVPDSKDMHPIDKLCFKPEMMNNTDTLISAEIHISTATMGQDQRHRTEDQTEPVFSGYVYLAALLAEMKLGPKLLEVMKMWEEVSVNLPGTLSTMLAPYGAMVWYKKSGNLNAVAHEMAKRTCWCTQEEIYHLSVQMREQILKKGPELEPLFSPPCIKSGKCGEGARYCGRDLTNLGFTERKV